MGIKRACTIATVTLLAVGLGLYGLSEFVVGQEQVSVFGAASATQESADLEIKVAPLESAASGTVAANTLGGPGAAAARARLAKAAEISSNLDQEILLEFNDAPLSEIVDYLSTARDLPIIIDTTALEDIGMAPDVKLSCNYKGISVRSALTLLLEPQGLDFVIRHEVLKITTRDVADTDLQPRFYSVAGADPDELIELITSMVAANSWDEVGGPGSIRALGKTHLVISQSDRVHDQVAEFLEKLRDATGQ